MKPGDVVVAAGLTHRVRIGWQPGVKTWCDLVVFFNKEQRDLWLRQCNMLRVVPSTYAMGTATEETLVTCLECINYSYSSLYGHRSAREESEKIEPKERKAAASTDRAFRALREHMKAHSREEIIEAGTTAYHTFRALYLHWIAALWDAGSEWVRRTWREKP